MGKGTIISGGSKGQYQVQINYDRVKYNLEIAALTEKILELTEKIDEIEAVTCG